MKIHIRFLSLSYPIFYMYLDIQWLLGKYGNEFSKYIHHCTSTAGITCPTEMIVQMHIS